MPLEMSDKYRFAMMRKKHAQETGKIYLHMHTREKQDKRNRKY